MRIDGGPAARTAGPPREQVVEPQLEPQLEPVVAGGGAARTVAPALAPHRSGDHRTLRGVLGMFATGITVVTSGREHPHGMTANAFSSVSLDPPLVLVCVDRGAVMHEVIRANGSFAVSVLGADQEHIARHFASRNRPRGWMQFEPVAWSAGPQTSAPLIGGALAWLECRLADVLDGGDHSIFLGSVLSLGRGSASGALLFLGGDYQRSSTHRR